MLRFAFVYSNCGKGKQEGNVMTEELEKNIEETAEDLLIIEDFEPEE